MLMSQWSSAFFAERSVELSTAGASSVVKILPVRDQHPNQHSRSYSTSQIIHAYKTIILQVFLFCFLKQFQQKFCKLRNLVYSEILFHLLSKEIDSAGFFWNNKEHLNVREANCQTQWLFNDVNRGAGQWNYADYKTDHYFLMGHRLNRFYCCTYCVFNHFFCLL